jgi:hypothetical protein
MSLSLSFLRKRQELTLKTFPTKSFQRQLSRSQKAEKNLFRDSKSRKSHQTQRSSDQKKVNKTFFYYILWLLGDLTTQKPETKREKTAKIKHQTLRQN